MLRLFYTMFDWLGSFFAIMSPISILDWLSRATGITLLAPVHAILDPFLGPLCHLMDMFYKFPTIEFGQQSVSSTQGFLGLVFTACFFVCSLAAQMLKTSEQKLNVTKEILQQQMRFAQSKVKEEEKRRQTVANRRNIVCITSDFPANQQTAIQFEGRFARFGGTPIEMTPDYMLIEFPTVEVAFQYALDAAQNVLGYYKTLRPMDPQPPFQIGIHCPNTTIDAGSLTRWCIQLANYASKNQIVLSKSCYDYVRALKKTESYQILPLGVYNFSSGGSSDIYKLAF